MKLWLIILLVALDFVAWLTAHFMCEYKYYWCDGDCADCHNWKCKYFKKGRYIKYERNK